MPSFFAREDTRTPVKIGVLCIFINILLSLSLINILDHAGIALATAISAWINVICLAVVLKRREYHAFDNRLKSRVLKICFASGGMGGVLWLFPIYFQIQTTVFLVDRIIELTSLIFTGLLTYILLSLVIGSASIKEVKAIFLKKSPLDPNS